MRGGNSLAIAGVTTLVDFNVTNGAGPSASLVEGIGAQL